MEIMDKLDIMDNEQVRLFCAPSSWGVVRSLGMQVCRTSAAAVWGDGDHHHHGDRGDDHHDEGDDDNRGDDHHDEGDDDNRGYDHHDEGDDDHHCKVANNPLSGDRPLGVLELVLEWRFVSLVITCYRGIGIWVFVIQKKLPALCHLLSLHLCNILYCNGKYTS